MPYAYAVNVVGQDEPVLFDDAESYDIHKSKLKFYTKQGCFGDEVALFNWDNVVQITPLSEDELGELLDLMG